MKKWLLLLALLLAGLVGYVVAGPYLAIHGIRTAVAEQDMTKLQRHVDFPALRVNLRAQAEDWLARQAGNGMQGNIIGSFALSVANQAAGRAVDTVVTPLGIAGVLQGRSLWKQLVRETVDGDSYGAAVPAEPLKHTQTKYESSSRFTATIQDETGKPTVFVFTRQGLRWKLTDIRLPY